MRRKLKLGCISAILSMSMVMNVYASESDQNADASGYAVEIQNDASSMSEAELYAYMAAQIDSKLAELGSVEVTDLYMIQEIRNVYDALPEEVQGTVKNYDKLEQAEKELLDIYLAEFDRSATLLEEAAAATKTDVMDGVTGLRKITEAKVILNELQCFGYGWEDVKTEDTKSLNEQAEAIDDLLAKYNENVFYPGTGIIKLDVVVERDLSKEDIGTERYEDDDYPDQYKYIYMLDNPYGNEYCQKYLEYLRAHFTELETTTADETTLYNFQDDMGNNISVHYEEMDVSAVIGDTGNSILNVVEVYFDKAIVDQKLHEYQGKNPIEGKELEYAHVGDTVYFGQYEQDNNKDNGKEQLEWIVLDEDEEGFLLLSKAVINAHAYASEKEEAVWENSDCRSWLNDKFFKKAFSKKERKRVRTTNVIAEDNPYYGTDAGADTEDKVFFLSAQEVLNYFPNAEDRLCDATPYAVAKGVTPDDAGHATWCTRTPGQTAAGVAACARNSGYIMGIGSMEGSLTTAEGGVRIQAADFGMRPAIWVSVDKFNKLATYTGGENAEGGSETGDSSVENPITIEKSTAKAQYKDWSFAPDGFLGDSSYKAENTLIVDFDYTNLADGEKSMQSDFWVRAYQNGVELANSFCSYYPGVVPSIDNMYKNVLKDGTITVGWWFYLKDRSPVTVTVNSNGGSETVSETMTIYPEEVSETEADEAVEEENTSAAAAANSDSSVEDPISIEKTTGKAQYNSWSYIPAGFLADDAYKPEDGIVVNFDYTNLEDKEKSMQSDFWVRAYQNGVEIDSSFCAYYPGVVDSIDNANKNVLKGGTITVGWWFKLTDNSPVTIIVKNNGGSEVVSETMVINL